MLNVSVSWDDGVWCSACIDKFGSVHQRLTVQTLGVSNVDVDEIVMNVTYNFIVAFLSFHFSQISTIGVGSLILINCL